MSPGRSGPALRSLAAADSSPWLAGRLPPAGLRSRASRGSASCPSPPLAGRPPLLHLLDPCTAAAPGEAVHCSPKAGGHTTPRVCKAAGPPSARGGAWGERGSVCVCSCMCVDADARGAPGGSGGGGLSTPAAYSSARRQRGRAGQFQEPAAASRALADTGKACDWPAAAPMQTS
nr:uncharacterized protein LOC131757846 [Kogia breviceps]